MTRLSLILMSLTGIAGLAFALMMRYELAAPGISALLSALSSDTGAAYLALLSGHRIFATAFALSAAAFACFVARDTGVKFFGFTGWVLLAVLVMILTACAALLIDPVSASALLNFPDSEPFEALLNDDSAPNDALTFFPSTYALLFGTIIASTIAALALTSAISGMHVAPTIITILLLVLWFGALSEVPSLFDIQYVLAATALGPLAILAIRMSDTVDPAAPYLAVGLLGLLGATIALLIQLNFSNYFAIRGTHAETASLHITLASLILFITPAALVLHWKPTLPTGFYWANAGAILGSLYITFAPQYSVGALGMPSAYGDYPDVFASLNLNATIGAFTFAAVWCAGVFVMWRKRAR